MWITDHYIRVYPGLVTAVEVPVRRDITTGMLAAVERGLPRVIPTVLRRITFGLTPSNDCVCVVVDLLRWGGVPVPRRTITPDALLSWLLTHGYQAFPLTDRLARLSASWRIRPGEGAAERSDLGVPGVPQE